MPFPWSGAGTAYALYLMRAGKPGSFRHELYNFLPLGGRGVFLVIGIFSGSLGATQYRLPEQHGAAPRDGSRQGVAVREDVGSLQEREAAAEGRPAAVVAVGAGEEQGVARLLGRGAQRRALPLPRRY